MLDLTPSWGNQTDGACRGDRRASIGWTITAILSTEFSTFSDCSVPVQSVQPVNISIRYFKREGEGGQGPGSHQCLSFAEDDQCLQKRRRRRRRRRGPKNAPSGLQVAGIHFDSVLECNAISRCHDDNSGSDKQSAEPGRLCLTRYKMAAGP